MFADFLRGLLSGERTDPLDDGDARLALCALLVRVARSDGAYDPEEQAYIDRIISARYGVDEARALELRTQAEHLEAEAPDTVRFTRAIKDAVAYEDRQAVVEALWRVVLADGRRDQHEDALLRMVAKLLGVNDRDSALARQRAQGT